MSVGIINKKPDTLRTFIAVELSAEIKSALIDVQRTMQRHAAAPNIRWVQPDAVHLTLKFVGDIFPAQVAGVQAGMEQVARTIALFDVALGGVGAFPSERAPRVLWVGLDGDTQSLKALAKNLDEELSRRGFPPEERGFSPHLTVGRTREAPPRRPKRRDASKYR
ncbi:MAG: RNA 2',3'-cyclic phosphodiesterase [Dehalococcoidia bacterium]|nr:RNA 2',3'-cyclic phosphodiesterase [Dehalococcoidia bacterium]